VPKWVSVRLAFRLGLG